VKKIEAIIQPHRLNDVTSTLKALGVGGMTVCDVNGHGRQQGRVTLYRGREYALDLLPKVKVEICVEDVRAAEVVEAMMEAARSGNIGDGKIFVSPVEDAYRIRNQDRGEAAL